MTLHDEIKIKNRRLYPGKVLAPLYWTHSW